jgi:putative ABC transport system permease protein
MRALQSASIVFMVLVCVAVVFAFALIVRGTSDGIQLASQRGGAQLMLLPAKAGNYLRDDALLFSGAPVNIYMDNDVFHEVASLPGVKRATRQFYAQTLDASCCSASGETRLVGIDTQTDWLVATLVAPEAAWSGKLAEREVVIGSEVNGFASGSGRLLGDDITVAAVMAPTGTGMDKSIIVSLQYARALAADAAGFERFWETNGLPEALISAVLIEPEPGEQERLIGRLEALGDVRVVERSNVIERSQQQLQAVFAILLAVGIIAAVASLLQLFGRYSAMPWERKGEFALYRAMGATRGDIRRFIWSETLILAGAGLVGGLVLGAILFGVLLNVLQGGGSYPFVMPSAGICVALVVSVVALVVLLCLLALALPLRRVSRIEPYTALQQMDIG